MKARIFLYVVAAGICLPAYAQNGASTDVATPVAGTIEAPDLTKIRGADITSTPVDTGPTLADARNLAAQGVPEISLIQALAEVIQKYPQREGARAALRAARARIGIAKADGGPQLGLTANGELNRNYGNSTGSSGNINNGNNNNFDFTSSDRQLFGFDRSEDLTINGSLPIYSGGRVRNSKRAAEANARAQAAQTLQITQDLVRTAIETYLNILRGEQLLEVEQSNLEVSRERSRIANVRFAAGAAARLEVLRADATLADAAQRRVDASNSLAQYRAALNILMARRPETPLRVVPVETLTPRIPIPQLVFAAQPANTEPAPGETVPVAATVVPLDNPSNDPLYAIALANRPTGEQYRELMSAAQHNVAVAKAGKKPTLGLSLRTFFRSPLESLSSFALTFGLGLAQNLFDSGRTSSQVSEARALVDQAKANYDYAQLQVANQIETALLNLDAAQKRERLSEAGVKAAEEALRAARLGYEAGATTSLEVTDAQAALLLAQQQAVNARFDVANAQSNLSAAVGVLTTEGQDAYQLALAAEAAREKTKK